MTDHLATVYVGNLPWGATEDDLVALFRDLGPVVDARIIQDRDTGRSSGYGFVQLQSPEAAAHACSALNGLVYRGRPLMVSPARPKPRRG